MGVKYDYNDITIEIPVNAMGASQIGISGVKIGVAADFDRIKSQLPGLVKVNDAVSSEYYSSTGFYYSNSSGEIVKTNGISPTPTAKITQNKSKDTTKYINLS